jgi:hydrogenase expression/formation protein HypD
MKYIDEFRDPKAAQALLREIAALIDTLGATEAQPVRLMEVCGGHTHSIFRYGIEGLLPKAIELVHGPGCPVCALPMGRIDDAIAIAERPEVIFTTFGDALRVPGSQKSLMQAKADGADIRIVYSPMDALELARANPDREVVFFGLGFETMMPSTALTVLQAVGNFSVFCNHITIVPTLKAILDSPDLTIDGFIGPGHVSMVIGTAPYEFIATHYQKPMVVSGFEPLDILQSNWMVLRQFAEEGCPVELLRRVAGSMAAAREAEVKIVTGDTKVVHRGACDKLFLTTSGVGAIKRGGELDPTLVRPGDAVLVNGVLGDHGATILAARGDLALGGDIESDCAPLNGLIQALLTTCPGTRFLRDATRGGVATVLNEIAQASAAEIVIEEDALPIRETVRGMCEILGLDPLYLANEGKFVAVVPAEDVDCALATMRAHPLGAGATMIGRVSERIEGRVLMRTLFGGTRIVDMLIGDQLPRIC